MGYADLKHLSNSDLQHPSPKSIKPISVANDLCLALVIGLPGPAHVLANCRFLFALCIAFPDLLDSPARDLHIQCNLLCSHPFLLLADNPMDLALVQFHNPCYGSGGKACAKYFRDYTASQALSCCLPISINLCLIWADGNHRRDNFAFAFKDAFMNASD